MTTRDDLLASIAATIADYRENDLEAPTPAHVDRWVNQFEANVHIPILHEINHVLKQTYIPKNSFKDYFSSLISNEKLTAGDPSTFWSRAHILDIQQNGQSQSHIRQLFGEALREKLGLEIDNCGCPGGPYIYLDDVIFSGGRVITDLSRWLNNNAPEKSTIHVLVMATHKLGEWQCENRLSRIATEVEKNIDLHVWAVYRLENRLKYKNSADVLWPALIPQDPLVEAYVAQEERFPLQTRTAGQGKSELEFTSEEGRQLLETELLKAGVRIRGLCQNPSDIMRPLGFGNFGVGFGSTIVTYRNCPNNAPLALWWGDPDAHDNHPFSKWYPLVQRRTYEQEIDFDDFDF